jgi:uncharacterized membrane protein
METVIAFFVLLILAVVIVPLILSIINSSKVRSIEATLKKLNERIAALELRWHGDERTKETTTPSAVAPGLDVRSPIATSPPPLPTAPSVPPPLPVPQAGFPPIAPPAVDRAIDWEAFMGVKLFAWLGGFILFLGVVFLVKYSFENNLVTPPMRVVIGAVIGLGLIGAGWRAAGKNFRVPAHSLCATGVLVLYADIFAAHAFYDLISVTPAFALMSVVTIATFFLAITLKAQVVVLLGLLGGFLTPILLATGRDDPVALFGYIALLNAGVAGVVLRKRWDYLALLAALGTVLTEFGWASEFFGVTKTTVAFVVFIGFELQFLLLFFLRRKDGSAEKWTTLAAAVVGFAALAFAFWMLDNPRIAAQRMLLFGFVLAADVGLLALALGRPKREPLPSAAGLVVFVFLAVWTARYLTEPLLWWALGSYLLFALVHSGFAAASGSSRRIIPAFCAATPFLLLTMVVDKLPMENPTPIFAVAFLLGVVLLGLGIFSRANWIAAIALIGIWGIERQWQTLHFSTLHPAVPFGWYIVFALLFVGYAFFTVEKDRQLPWAISAISGALHFWLIFEVVSVAYPRLQNGLLPALFILPYAFGVFFLITRCGIIPASGDAKLAWQGGAALLFVSLIFPIQFDREWITLGWAVEGLALILLFHVVPHRGLRVVGTALLCVAFVRLALNPAVFEYHKRTAIKIWNWYLYAYGITSLCLLVAARFFKPPRENPFERAAPALLYSLGAILTFLLLNIEIADYFSIGPTLTFSFSGNFARDMTYSIAWALFAFALLLIGMKCKSGAVRYAGVGLLLVTLAKLFLHDLGNLSQLYRIGAFIAVAIVLIVASFIYQRFLAPASKLQ